MPKVKKRTPASENDAGVNGITELEKRFCEELLVDLNQTQAAIRAGYSAASARTTGSQIMDKPAVRAYAQRLMDQRSARAGVNADYVLNTIVSTIERCRQAEPVMELDPGNKQMVPTGEYKFDSRGVLTGCHLLGQHLELFTKRIKVTDETGLAEKMAKARKRMQAKTGEQK